MTLILGWGDPLHLFHESRSAPAARTTWHAMLAGLRASSIKGGYAGIAEAVEVEFTPLGAFADRAAACGYHDQAHMNRDFRDLAGLTPAQLRLLADRAASRGRAPLEGRLADVFDH
ncbi:hypothetical protein ACIRL2_47090 [Embleya sp. NPDC127516]|uniref:hypothetical protein n=1 Tax=Embleya sp. NPDC127516 TaxID=3363990 RepID=UPI0038143D1E